MLQNDEYCKIDMHISNMVSIPTGLNIYIAGTTRLTLITDVFLGYRHISDGYPYNIRQSTHIIHYTHIQQTLSRPDTRPYC